MNCEYCNKQFANKGNLNYHQKTAKYCIQIRETGVKEIVEKTKESYDCEFCQMHFTRKFNLITHLTTCKEKNTHQLKKTNEKLLEENKQYVLENNKFKNELDFLNRRIDEYREEVKELKNQIKELAEKAIDKNTYQTTNEITDNRTVNTNNSNNKMIDNRVLNMLPLNLTRDNLIQTLEEKFSESHLMKGQKGVAEFMLENVLVVGDKDNKKFLMKCTDPSRKTFITVDKDGNIQKDINASHLTKIISEPVKEKCQQIFRNIQDNYFATYENVGNELEEGDEDSIRLNTESAKLDYATNRVVEISRLKNDNTEFVKNLIPSLS